MYTLTNLYNDLIRFTRVLNEPNTTVTVYPEFDEKYLDENYTKTIKKRLLNTRISFMLSEIVRSNKQIKTLPLDKQLELYDYFNTFADSVTRSSGKFVFYVPLTIGHLKERPDLVPKYVVKIIRYQLSAIRDVRRKLNKRP